MVKNVIFLSTGGTIEKSYDELDGSMKNIHSRIQDKVLPKLRYSHLTFLVKQILNKDSLEFTEVDRQIIADAVVEQLKIVSDDPIVIIHGTDTLHKSYCFLEDHFSKNKIVSKVPIIFTGAMRPLELDNTDAYQNVTESILASQLLEGGIYLVFHGQVYKDRHFVKDFDIKSFKKQSI